MSCGQPVVRGIGRGSGIVPSTLNGTGGSHPTLDQVQLFIQLPVIQIDGWPANAESRRRVGHGNYSALQPGIDGWPLHGRRNLVAAFRTRR
jgi:hypothetical protein